MIAKAFRLLYPEKPFPYATTLSFSHRFSKFNANIRKSRDHIEVGMSAAWKDIGEEIQIGLVQHLLMKLFKDKRETMYTQLYSTFIKNVGAYVPKNDAPKPLQDSFDRVNAYYFQGQMQQPSLRWGQASTRQLGLYNFHNDMITISSIFQGEDEELIDYIMYHELLHKQEKFEQKKGRTHYHTKTFREKERKFKDFATIDRRIAALLRKKKRKTWKWW